MNPVEDVENPVENVEKAVENVDTFFGEQNEDFNKLAVYVWPQFGVT